MYLLTAHSYNLYGQLQENGFKYWSLASAFRFLAGSAFGFSFSFSFSGWAAEDDWPKMSL